MQDFISRGNIRHFEKLIKADSDGDRVRVLRQLLAEEKKKIIVRGAL